MSPEQEANNDHVCIADATGATDTSAALSDCLINAPKGARVVLPVGTYRISKTLFIKRSDIAVTTQGAKPSDPTCSALPDSNCARLLLDENFSDPWGTPMVTVGSLADNISADRVTIDHLIFDGNRQARLPKFVNQMCDFHPSLNVQAATDITINGSAFVETACMSAFMFTGPLKQDDAFVRPTITNNLVANNGDKTISGTYPRVSDGLTIVWVRDGKINGNIFRDNTDVSLILGGGINTEVAHNTFEQKTIGANVALMLTNWSALDSTATLADFTNLNVHHNTFDCNTRCDIAIQLGVYVSVAVTDPATRQNIRVSGGVVEYNTVSSTRQGINVAGVGPNPIVIRHNDLSGVIPNPNNVLLVGSTRATNKFNWPHRWYENVIDLDDLSQIADLSTDENDSWEKIF